jgi:hypothetical protein
VPLLLSDGQLILDGRYIRGDLNGDGVVNAADAAIALGIASRKTTPTPLQELAGGVNGDGVINSADASMILYYAAHQEWPPMSSLISLHRYNTGNTVLVTPGTLSGQAGSEIEIPVFVDNSSNVAGGTFIMQHGDDLEYLSARLDDSLNYLLATHQTASGELHISLAGNTTMSGGQQTLVWLRFQIDASATESDMWVDVTGAWLNDLNGRDFVISALQREVIGGQGNVQLAHKVFLPVVIR